MSNQTDFNILTGRIEVATTSLEDSADVLANGTADLQENLTEVREAKEAVILAQTQINTKVDDAQTAIDESLLQSDSLNTQAIETEGVVTGLVGDLMALAPFDEAPEDGKIYGRKDKGWEVVDTGDTVAVTSVNTIEADAFGDVTLTAADVGALADTYVPSYDSLTGKPELTAEAIGALPDTYVPDWGDVTSKPTLGTLASKDDAPQDTKQYVRKGQAWEEFVSPPSGVTDLKFPVDEQLNYDGSLTGGKWISDNANTPAELSKVSLIVSGRRAAGEDFFSSAYQPARFNGLPDANYTFTSSTFTSTSPLAGLEGVIYKHGDWAFAVASVGKSFVYTLSTTSWQEVGAGEEGEGGGAYGQTWAADYVKYRKDASSAFELIYKSPFTYAGEVLPLSNFQVFDGTKWIGATPSNGEWRPLFISGSAANTIGMAYLARLPVGSYKVEWQDITTNQSADLKKFPSTKGTLAVGDGRVNNEQYITYTTGAIDNNPEGASALKTWRRAKDSSGYPTWWDITPTHTAFVPA